MKKFTRLLSLMCVLAAMVSMFILPASAAYTPEEGDEVVYVTSKARISPTAGYGYIYYNTLTNRTWAESGAYVWGGTTYMYVYCKVTADDGTSKSSSNSSTYDGSDTARSLTTSKLTCSCKSGRHTVSSHTITGSWYGTEKYTGSVYW